MWTKFETSAKLSGFSVFVFTRLGRQNSHQFCGKKASTVVVFQLCFIHASTSDFILFRVPLWWLKKKKKGNEACGERQQKCVHCFLSCAKSCVRFSAVTSRSAQQHWALLQLFSGAHDKFSKIHRQETVLFFFFLCSAKKFRFKHSSDYFSTCFTAPW